MPVERMRMRPWLEEQIDSNKIPGLKWLNKEKKIFQIPWMHAARHGWDVEKDAPLFKNWAVHTGKYLPGISKPDPKTWKANFRCAMNSLPDIEEVKDKSIKKGNNAFRVYRMLPPSERPAKKGKKKMEKSDQLNSVKMVKVEDFSPSEFTNGVDCTSSNYVMPSISSITVKEEFQVDSTVHSVMEDSSCVNHSGEQMIIINTLDVCQVVEVTTESDDQPVSTSQLYPLQISPVSSYEEESETDSVPSEEENTVQSHPSHLQWQHSNIEGKQYLSNTGGRSTYLLPSMATFVTSNKPDLKVTIKEEPEDESLLTYESTTANMWTNLTEGLSFPPLTSSGLSSSRPSSETRASVIKKTSDIAQSTVKTC